MYIKEIRLNSFKSFADKVNIELKPTFTGIVGPNGSGKSNIVDAVKWVLGEQSIKTLRGASGMADVIFNGSKSRNSSNQASVSIIFDNSDKTIPMEYGEISIKRTINKVGENEYFLNNEKCRLKDINDLLLDSFSSRESFNIIPQNKIDEILSDKPEDRRIIFEEAAGVLKYKKRKEETLRKLNKTHENIERINVITDELETQVSPLEKASIKAREYKENKEKLESVEIALIVKDITSFSELLNVKKETKEKISLELTSLLTKKFNCGAEIEKLKVKNINIEEKLSALREDHLKNKGLLADLLSKKELSIERSKYDKKSDAVRNKLVEIKESKLKTENEIKSLTQEVENLSSLESLKKSELNNLLSSGELKELEAEKNNYDNLKRKEFEIKSKIELLESNLENMSKLPYAVKSILDNPSLSGINNIIGNVIDAEEKYRVMLEVTLGTAANYVIVEDEASAKGAIEYLKNNNKGRATFFPLSVIKPRSIEPGVLSVAKKLKGFIGVSSDLVQYQNKYYNIIMNQLGNIIVVDNINNALNISKEINHRYRIVTLNGELLHVGGSLSGGSFKTSNSYISDKYEIDKLNVLLEHVSNNIKESDKKITEYLYNNKIVQEKVINLNIELAKFKEKIQNKNNQIEELKILLDKNNSEIKDLNNKTDADKTLEKIMEKYYKTEELTNELEQKINFTEGERKNNVEEIAEMENSLKSDNAAYSSMNEQINNIEIEIVKLNMALDTLLNRLNEEYSLTYEGAKSKYLLEIEESEARKTVSDLKKLLKSIGNVNFDSIEEYERVNKRYTFLNKQKSDLKNSEEDLLEIIQSMDTVMSKRFEKAFNNISEEFSKVFKKLFGGGEANLKLTDPTNILETGIDIIAIPPGKSMKSLSLLSGGEKTLTAISLLFSIMNLKKVPFVILDEVESALDEVNAEKFGEYLANYRGKTQLLIITHKKKTMEYVDLLYGVTMQESGVSKLVSVKLENVAQ